MLSPGCNVNSQTRTRSFSKIILVPTSAMGSSRSVDMLAGERIGKKAYTS
jgi:hypothetical protein